ncbi:unnamed protein product [Ciceribacter sp. T2.26MG-112.2]|nr:unnamed protein product [Ciceribacter naphthalenivorans]
MRQLPAGMIALLYRASSEPAAGLIPLRSIWTFQAGQIVPR